MTDVAVAPPDSASTAPTAPSSSARPPTLLRPATPAVTTAWLTLTGAERPPFADVLLVTDLLHDALAAHLARERGRRADSVLLGVHADGSPLKGHAHAHFLGLPGPDGRIAEVIVHAPDGLAPDEVTALSRVDVLRGGAGDRRLAGLPLRLSALGGAEQLPEELVGPATRWRSLTPYVPTGHPKGSAEEFVARRLPRDAAQAPALAGVGGAVDWSFAPRGFPGRFETRRARDRQARRFTPPSACVELTFAEPVAGPLCLGHLTHFGLGWFEAMAG